MSKTRGARAGTAMGRVLVEWLNLMYNKNTALRVLRALINELSRGCKRFENALRRIGQ